MVEGLSPVLLCVLLNRAVGSVTERRLDDSDYRRSQQGDSSAESNNGHDPTQKASEKHKTLGIGCPKLDRDFS